MNKLHKLLRSRVFTFTSIVVVAGLLVSLLHPWVQAATPTFRQARTNRITSGTVDSLAFSSANVAGNLSLVYVVWSNTGSASVTDSLGNTYVGVGSPTAWGTSGVWRSQVFYAKNIAAGSNTVTATFGTAVTFGELAIHEYSNIDKVNPLDVSTAAVGTASAMNSGSVTTTNANDLIFGAGASSNSITAVGSGFTSRSNANGNRTEDKNVTTTGSYNATATQSGTNWVMHMVALKAANDVTAPTAPTNLTATPASSSQISLSWTASTDNVGVTGYQVERCQGSGCANFAPVTTVATTNFTDSGLTASTLYRYRVRATDAALNFSSYSSIAQATTPAVTDTTPPSVPTGLSGTGVSVSQINLSWTASTDNVGVTGYKVFRDGNQVGTSATTSFQDTGLAANSSHTYAVSAFDAATNNSAQSSTATASTLPDTTAPSVPTNVTTQVASSTQINLNWNASTDNVGVAGYKIYRDGTFLKNSTVMPVQDSGLTPGTTYSYTVSAFDAVGNESAQTAPVTGTTPPPDNTPPTASMTAPALGATVSGTITVSANATDNVAVADVDFLLDGVSIGVDATAPYSVQWNTTTTSNGQHTLSARARDTAGNFGVTSGVVTVMVSNSSAPPLPADLMAGWPFAESTGTTTADVTPYHNTASFTTISNPVWGNGKYGSGMRFNGGLNDYLTIADSPTLNISGTALTWSAWINPSGGGSGDQVVFGKFWNGGSGTPHYQYGLELGGGVTPNFYIGTTNSTMLGANMGSALPVGQWSHLAVVFDGARAAFYLNGNLMSTPSMSGSIAERTGSTIRMGGDLDASQRFVGSLDDVRIYKRALTQTEVQADKNNELTSPTADPNGPTVVITAPANNAQVSGIITVTADADDNQGVAGVQFIVDGTLVGLEDTTAPYSVNLDTRTLGNGAHTLTARARDTSGNLTVSNPVTVNAANSDYFQNEILATGFDLPTVVKFLPDGRMLVAELQGKIKVLSPPYTTPSPTLFGQVVTATAGVQEGIYDLALDPNFSTNHYYYVFYTAHTGSGDFDRLERFTANATLDGTIAGSGTVLYQDPNGGGSDEHHGGAVTFSNDGKIMFTVGERFNGPDAQNLTNPRGKVLRINMDGSIPTDNPFYDGAGPNFDAIYSYGLRNPYRAYFDTPTNRMLIGDVGGNDGSSNEEVNVAAPGANFGWPNYEGQCTGGACASPLYDYEHNNRDACITGGFVYHGTQFPSGMQGNYFFGDYAQNWIKRISFDANGNVTGVFNFEPANGAVDTATGDIVYLTEGPDGALYYLDLGYSDTSQTYGVSKVRRIRYLQSNQAPIANASADTTSGPLPLTVNFSSAGSSDPEGQPITYLWDFGDGTTSTLANPSHAYTVAGMYTVRLTVNDGVNSTFSAPIMITAGSAPTVTIAAPLDGATFRAGDVISYNGDANDPEDGNLPASAFSWTVDFLHDGHVHPGQTVTGVKSGSFTVPSSGHDFSGNTRYRITLSVTDSNGLVSTKSVTVWPQKVNLSFDTTPTGLTLYLDGIAKTTPFVYDTLIGFNHTIDARNQSVGSTNYAFGSWSDGGAQLHTITVPATAQSYLATYTVTQAPTGIMAAWGFNETSGTTTLDSSGNNNTATLLNGIARVAGKYGNGLSFDGSNDYLSAPNSSSLNITGNALTLSMWVNPSTTASGDQVVIGKHWNANMTSPYYQYGLELQSNGSRPVFGIGTTGGVIQVAMSTTLTKGVWSHLAIVWNGSTVQFYVNGALVQTSNLSTTITARTNPLQLGADASPSQFYKGLLDNVRIYNRVLNATEVQSDMNTAL